MRILFVSPRSAWVRHNLVATLRATGHDIVAWDWGAGWPVASPDWIQRRERTGQRLIEAARAHHRNRPFDLVFCYLYSSVVGPAVVTELRGLGAPVVNFSCNNVHQFDLVAEIAPSFDLCIVPERSALEAYRSIGARTLHLGMAANPAVYRPHQVAEEFDVAFVGQRYADRAEYVLYLKRHGVDVRVWGAGWRRGVDAHGAVAGVLSVLEDEGPRALVEAAIGRLRRLPQRSGATVVTAPRGLVSDEEELSAIAGHRLLHADMVKLFSRSRVSLGFATVGDSHRDGQRLTQVRLRDFEATMSEAFYITEQQEELSEYFDPGREIETYEHRDELLDKVRFYLAHRGQADAIGTAGRARALAEHTWEHRFQRLFKELGLSKHHKRAVGV